MTDTNKGLTEIQKNMLLELKQSDLKAGFESDFVDSIFKSYEKEWSLSVNQAQCLTDLYDRKILGNTEEKMEFQFGLIKIVRNDHNKMWKIWIESRELDEQFTRKDALIIANFLNDHFPGICMDIKMEPDIMERFMATLDEPELPAPPNEPIVPDKQIPEYDATGSYEDEPDPF